MSREIKFRAWDIHNEQMCEVPHINLKGKFGVMSCAKYTSSFVFEEVILEQYTGLKAVLGVDVYEGDIVKFKVHKKKNPQGWQIGKLARVGAKFIIWSNWYHYDITNNIIEVIGNIHENPELLEVQE